MREDEYSASEHDAGLWEAMRAEPDTDAPTRLEAERDEAAFPVWWTHCEKCGISVTLRHEERDLEDPDDLDTFVDCPYCAVPLTDWNGDLL